MSEKKGLIILSSGWKGSGKDTFINFLAEKHGFVRFAFADDLKDQSSSIYNLGRDDMDDPQKKAAPMLHCPVIASDEFAWNVQRMIYTHFSTATGASPTIDPKDIQYLSKDKENDSVYWKGEQLYWTLRAVLISEGSIKRTIDPNYWVDRISHCTEDDDTHTHTGKLRIGVSDCRYRNEIKRITYLYAPTCRVIVVRIDVDEPPKSTDASERSLDDYEGFYARILNKKEGIQKFHKQIEEALGSLF